MCCAMAMAAAAPGRLLELGCALLTLHYANWWLVVALLVFVKQHFLSSRSPRAET
jgi:hypothetical protein